MPDKKLRFLIGVGVLALASLLYGILAPSKGKREPASGPETAATKTIPAAGDEIPLERQTRRTRYPTWGGNPFSPRETTDFKTYTALVLNGIAWDETNPRAVINDRIVGVGDEIAGNKVVAIEQNKVVLNDGVSDFELRPGQQR